MSGPAIGFDDGAVEDVDCVVAGAGVVGLAVARALALQGREVLVLEAADAIGTGTSSRNSEVIHAGIYYPQGSLKARLCVQGKQQLYRYCDARGIGHRRCGKLIVATSAVQLPRLEAIRQQAARNGVDDLVLLDAAAARALEPQLQCAGALLSPSTGIVDSHAFMLALQGDLEHAGGTVALNSPLAGAAYRHGAIYLVADGGLTLRARSFVNATGLTAPHLAQAMQGYDTAQAPQAYYAKGHYFSLAGRAPFERLVYPVPEAAGLGVHLTLDLGGQARFGPDVEWVDSPTDLAVDPRRSEAFYAEIRRYWPALQDGALQPAYAGIRPKIAPPGAPAADFVVQGPVQHGVPGLVHLFGIESPGLTGALALGDEVVRALG